jgi:hypothetical protein
LPGTLGEDLNALGWRTGAVAPHPFVAAIAQFLQNPGCAPAQVDQAHWLVVVSQSCDVVAHTIKQEPYVEVLHCTPIAKLRRQTKELRSTRVLDFKPNPDTHPELVLTAHATADRYLVPRELLLQTAPDPTRHLGEPSRIRMSAWYSLRYGRPAWPNNFNARIDTDKFEEILEPLADDIAEVRVSIVERDQELDEGTPYHVAVYFVVDEKVWNEEPEQREAAQLVFADFVSALAACPGIEVIQKLSEVVSGAKFTWQSMQLSDAWNFANLSYKEEA